jgi:hypothetical protein
MKSLLRRTVVSGACVIAAAGLTVSSASATIQPPHKDFSAYGSTETVAYDNAIATAASAGFSSCTFVSASQYHPTLWTVTVSCPLN